MLVNLVPFGEQARRMTDKKPTVASGDIDDDQMSDMIYWMAIEKIRDELVNGGAIVGSIGPHQPAFLHIRLCDECRKAVRSDFAGYPATIEISLCHECYKSSGFVDEDETK
ncbi:unnamed protein product [Caenorhabditis bovis]|uniref:Uncharacterized protein n=1 Tax=Caenorhabditis bovis TaxID=2654633 RepID=A0A8S1EQY7_9PELO|nr:unnamed protein product [Caenorhabditis bovis]